MKRVTHNYYSLVLKIAAIAICLNVTAQLTFAKPALGYRWKQNQLVSMDKINHASFDALLQKYVDEDGYVDYKSWKASSTNRKALQNYLGLLSRANRSLRASKEAKVAFWINAYNAVTLEGIMQVYPTSSIRNHTAKVFGYNIWKELPLMVGREQFSLEDIEHKILRKAGEPRIHFAIVCASIGCPRLMNHAYTAKNLEKQLSTNAKDFFSRKTNFRADASRRTIHVSSILDWFGSDFGNLQSAQFTYLKLYLPKQYQNLATDSRTTVRYIDYNWNLNDQSKKR